MNRFCVAAMVAAAFTGSAFAQEAPASVDQVAGPGGKLPGDPKIALVLAGGAVSGGAFKVGGLKALDDYLVGRKMTELDLYVGLSAGSILAASLAARCSALPRSVLVTDLNGVPVTLSCGNASGRSA